MKKKLVVVIACVALLTLALPGAAFAANSPTKTIGTATGSNGATITVTGTDANATGLNVESSSKTASNLPSGTTAYASFEVYYTDGHTTVDGNLILTFNVGAANAGKTATVYIQHGSGATEVQTATVDASGNISLTVTELSIFSVVLSDGNGSGSAIASSSSTSPKTGVDFTGVAVIAGVALAGAGVAFAVRRRISE